MGISTCPSTLPSPSIWKSPSPADRSSAGGGRTRGGVGRSGGRRWRYAMWKARWRCARRERRAPYAEALQALRRVPGIGRKVADCILLFSLDKPEACPVDVWVWRVMRELYGHQLRPTLPEEPPGGSAGPSERAYRAIQSFAW